MQVRSSNLDRDVQSEYQVEITAYDSGNPQNSRSINVTVKLTDVNDKPPVFDTKTVQPLEVAEDEAIGTGNFILYHLRIYCILTITTGKTYLQFCMLNLNQN